MLTEYSFFIFTVYIYGGNPSALLSSVFCMKDDDVQMLEKPVQNTTKKANDKTDDDMNSQTKHSSLPVVATGGQSEDEITAAKTDNNHEQPTTQAQSQQVE